MRWKESSFWLLFFLFCFSAGYLHGLLPDFRLQTAFSSPEKVRIVVFEKFLFPDNLIKLLEEKTHTEIQIEEIKDWQEARLKTVLNPGAHLLFLPSYWVPSLAREGRLRSINTLKETLDNEISPELRKINEDVIYDIPLYWTIFEFALPTSFKDENFEKLLESPKIQSIDTYHDLEIAKIRVQHEPWNYPNIQKKINPRLSLDAKEIKILPNVISEVSIHQRIQNPELTYNTPKSRRPLQTFSLAVPNNSPQKATSLALIKSLIQDEEFDNIYEKIPVGTSLNRLDKKLSQRIQRPSYLKELSFNELFVPEMVK